MNVNLEKLLTLTIEAKTNNRAILDLENLLKGYILEQEATKKGNKNTYKSMMKLINKYSDDSRESIKGTWIDKNENFEDSQYYTNGFMMIEIHNIIEELPKSDGIPSKVMKDTKDACINETKVKLNIKDIKVNYKIAKIECKAQKINLNTRKEWLVNIHNSYVSPELLLEICSVLGEDIEVYAPDSNVSPIYIKASTGNALILPVRVKD